MPRTLVLSLLRAGDALVHLPALAALRAADPGGELHVLVQAASRPVAPLLATQATVHVLPVDHRGGPLGPCAGAIDALRALRFDLAVNLTHRASAAEVAEAVGAARQLGLVRQGGALGVTSPWLSTLNDWGTSPALSVLHYGDVACQAVGLPRGDPGLRGRLPASADAWWQRTRAGLDLAPGARLVALQLTTSEAKKTWPPARWGPFARALRARDPAVRLVAVAAPSEADAVAAALAGSGAAVLACSFTEAARLLAEAALLVTGDTALVHLAALVGAPVLLLSSGSSAFRELGPAGEGHVVLQADHACAPCAHDPGCIAGGLPCVDAFAPELVADVAAACLSGALLPAPAPGARVARFRSRRDARGLVDYAPEGRPPADTACAELLREHLLDALPVACAPPVAPAAPAATARPPGAHERGPLEELRAAARALRARASGDPAPLAGLVRTLSSPFVLALVAAAGARLRDGDAAAVDAELARLEARAARRLAETGRS